MTDEMTTGPGPYPIPALAVRATYPATDGLVPEEIVIEFGGDSPVDPDLVDRAVAALAGVAAGRHGTVRMHHRAGITTLENLPADGGALAPQRPRPTMAAGDAR